MRRSSLFLLLTASALLLSALLWAGAALGRRIAGAERAAEVRRGTLEDAVTLSGVVLRSETLLSPSRAEVRLLSEVGARVSAGSPLAIEYDSGEEYFLSALLLSLRARQALTESPPPDAAAAYAAALARRELSALPLAARGVGASLGLPGTPGETLEAEIAALSARGEAGILSAPAAGYFTAAPDGWEETDPRTLTPSALRQRLESPDAPGGGPGVLVTGSEWSFCALVGPEEGARFSPGDRLHLRLPEGGECAARVGSVITQGRDTLVTFRCREHLGEVLSLRRTELTAVFARYEGLLLPAAALREQAGESFVRRADLPLGGQTPVTVLFRQGELALVRSESLREGMAVQVG